MNPYLDIGGINKGASLIVIFLKGFRGALKILELKLEDKHWPIIKPFLIFLKYIKNEEYTGITMDPNVVDILRKI